MRKPLSGLNGKGKLKLAVVAALATTAQAAFAGGINPANNNTTVTQQNGVNIKNVDVVNIATPNAKGLSHNKFNDYNVSKQGAVLNNATSAAHSQILKKTLGPNANLNGKAASVILNEVVSKNPSTLLGLQEVLGNSAKLVIANPNGITCDGCGFINTPNASLVVGKPNISDDELKSFDVSNQNAALSVSGTVSAEDTVLNLVAPKVTVNGQVKAGKQLNIIAGLNKVGYDKNGLVNVIEPIVPTATAISSFDAQLMGAMQAGRIRIVNTAQGAGVNLQAATLTADNGIDIESAGNIALKAKQQHKFSPISSTSLTSKNGDINLTAKNDINLEATKIDGLNVALNTEKGNIASTTKQQITSTRIPEKIDKSKFRSGYGSYGRNYERTVTKNTSNKKTIISGTEISSKNKINVSSGDSVSLVGTKLKSKDGIDIAANNSVTLEGKKYLNSEEKVTTNIRDYSEGYDSGGFGFGGGASNSLPDITNIKNIEVNTIKEDILKSELKSSGEINISSNNIEFNTALINSEKKVDIRSLEGDINFKSLKALNKKTTITNTSDRSGETKKEITTNKLNPYQNNIGAKNDLSLNAAGSIKGDSASLSSDKKIN